MRLVEQDVDNAVLVKARASDVALVGGTLTLARM